ncbi:DUF262 domain-containing protein [Sulfidibacter corallicola]|uniref:DUF262 domain-containing protein n=1 Tax=Sulfidibacter corallicola TaxID=2818388 RepID=A0A8A4TT79_SULCO|nr:DUF262 domain-containing protein [Sulfidibacter corallicola]QTD49745.1 DUF262 domain-containing protein [Sulfidibacter corallicola]
MSLREEIEKGRAEIKTDDYSMSIGEWLNLYENDEIDVHPEFQRFFRWSNEQKSRLIESILLGIPLPQIFVSQRSDGVWDVVDGLQRLSTIYEFAGVLRDENGGKVKPLILGATKYLPSLENKTWQQDEDQEPFNAFSQTERLFIKRAKLPVSIILKESDKSSKYELFQRLNTGGSPLSDQEVRNCLLVRMNPDLYRNLRKMADYDDFKDCTSLTDKALAEQYDLELVLRFVIFRQMDIDDFRAIRDVSEFVTEKMIELAQRDDSLNIIQEEYRVFSDTFSILNSATSSDSFRRYSSEKDKFLGGFLLSGFECVALGIGYNIENKSLVQADQIESRVKEVWGNQIFIKNTGSGYRAPQRMPKIVPLGREAFKSENPQ